MQWISTKIAVPRAGLDVIACCVAAGQKVAAFAQFDGTNWLGPDARPIGGIVTHWLVLEWPRD
jgi:hypothetical protein